MPLMLQSFCMIEEAQAGGRRLRAALVPREEFSSEHRSSALMRCVTVDCVMFSRSACG
jgi:hypothetical protein